MKSFLVGVLLLFAARAAAQDLGGAVNLGDLSRTQTNNSMMRAQAARDRKAQLAGKRPARLPRTPAEQRRAHQLEVQEAMRRRPAAPGSIR